MVTSNDSQMEQILDQLGSGKGLPVDAIRAADAHRAAMVPVLLRAFDQSASAGPSMQDSLFIAFHLLGQWRERSAYRPLAAFLRRPEVEPILGDATTVTCHRVMAGVFDGDPNPLYDVILDPAADEFIRARMCDALVIATLRGELPREEAARFLRSSYADLQPQAECFVWQGWQCAVALLGLSELKPLVRQAFERGFISRTLMRFKNFEEDLQRAKGGKPVPWQKASDYEPFGDIIEELQDWDAFAPEQETTSEPEGLWSPLSSAFIPAVNPFRGVGRNDPCPCGSGKKFKKCCLDSARPDRSATRLPETDPELEWSPDAASAVGKINEAVWKYDPHVEPNRDNGSRWTNSNASMGYRLITGARGLARWMKPCTPSFTSPSRTRLPMTNCRCDARRSD